MNDSFLSIVEDKHDSGVLLVRARVEGDIEKAFPDAAVVEGGGTDYRFRAFIDRGEVVEAIADRVSDIDYPNFKESVPDDERHEVYANVWATLMALQDDGKKT